MRELKSVFISREQNSGHKDNTEVNKSFEKVADLKNWGTAQTGQYRLRGEVKGTLNLGNALNHSVSNLLCSRLLTTPD